MSMNRYHRKMENAGIALSILAIGLVISWWAFIVWAIYSVVTHVTGG